MRLQTLDFDRQVARCGVEYRCCFTEQRFALLKSLERAPPGKRLYSPCSGCDRSLRYDLEHANVYGRIDVRTAAELGGKTRHADNPDAVTIFFAKKGNRASG